MASFSSGFSIAGSFSVTRYSADREIIEERCFKNIVLDIGYDNFIAQVFQSTPYPRYLFLGTGTTEPTAQDSGLQARSPTLNAEAVSGFSPQTPYYVDDATVPNGSYLVSDADLTFEYDQGAAEGVWTELGLAFDDDYLKPFNRTLFKNENGEPESITILSDEYLSVTYRVTLHTTIPVSMELTDPDGNAVTAVLENAKPSVRYFDNRWYATPLMGLRFFGTNTSNMQFYPRSSVGSVSKGTYVESLVFDPVEGSVTAEYSIPPGKEVILDGCDIYMYNATTLEAGTYNFSTPIIKGEDYRLTFTYKHSLTRMPAVEEVAE